MMSKSFGFALLFTAFLLSPGKAGAQSQYDSLSPVITLDDTAVVDFDTLVEGDTMKYTFWYTNTGKSELHIKQTWPSCGCTVPVFSPASVAPGGRGRIDIEFHSAGFKGPLSKYIIVISANAAEVQPRFKVHVLSKEEQVSTHFVRKKDRVKATLKKKKTKKAAKKRA